MTADATGRVPEHSQVVLLYGRRFDGEPLVLAHRRLHEYGPEQAKAEMRADGWDRVAAGYVGFWQGVFAVPNALLLLAALAAAVLGVVFLVARTTPAHWSLRGPQRRACDARELFRWVNAAGRHMGTFRGCSRSVGGWCTWGGTGRGSWTRSVREDRRPVRSVGGASAA